MEKVAVSLAEEEIQLQIIYKLHRINQETVEWFLEVVDSQTPAAPGSIRTSSPCGQ